MQDFSVVKVSPVRVEIHGHLVDTTNLSPFAGEFKDVKEISFEKIYSVTWLGLQKLLDFLTSTGRVFRICKVHEDLFSLICVFPHIGSRFGFEDIYIPTFDEEGNINHQKTLYKFSKIIKCSRERGNFINCLHSGGLIYASMDHYYRPFMSSEKSKLNWNFKSLWCRAHRDVCIFWHDYSSFLNRVIFTSMLAQHATSHLIEENLQRVTMRVSRFEAAVKLVDKSFDGKRTRHLMKSFPRIRALSETSVKSLDLLRDPFDNFHRSLFYRMATDEHFSAKSIFKYLQSLSQLKEKIIPVSNSLEELGAELGEKVLSFGEISQLKEVFRKSTSDNLDEKTIAKIRRKMHLQKRDENTWVETKHEIGLEMRALMRDIEKCVVALQGFDLVRQVLEHRINELSLLEDKIREAQTHQNFNWSEVRDSVLSQAHVKLVTDQEKLFFRFLFPDFEPPKEEINQDDAQQGVLMLF